RVELEAKAYLPHIFISNDQVRLEIYHRLSQISNLAGINDIRNELRDRFGPIPEPLENLLKMFIIRLLGNKMQFQRIIQKGSRYFLYFSPNADISPEKLSSLLDVLPCKAHIQYDKNVAIVLELGDNSPDDNLQTLINTLNENY
ncbi:MAG: TRCF domain-containing protein, partial [bacterium]